jgi:hypothetical protein
MKGLVAIVLFSLTLSPVSAVAGDTGSNTSTSTSVGTSTGTATSSQSGGRTGYVERGYKNNTGNDNQSKMLDKLDKDN